MARAGVRRLARGGSQHPLMVEAGISALLSERATRLSFRSKMSRSPFRETVVMVPAHDSPRVAKA